MARQTAGSPTDEAVKWTDLRPSDIALHLREEYREEVSHGCIKRILKGNGYRYRKPAKSLAIGKSPVRAEQFELIWFLITLFIEMENNPLISIDTKKKELLGQFTRNQPVLSKDEAVETLDHDYPYLGTGKAIPHGIYDVKENKGYISLGNSHETAAFVVDNFAWWWENYGQEIYPQATTILILCDSGGANGHRHHLFKKCLQAWAKKIGKRLVICHYPEGYCSKYNPIERRLFAQVHRTIERTILTDIEQVKRLMEKTVTKTGLSVEVRINDKYYPLKQPSLAEEIDEKRIVRHPELPKLAYTILPS